MKFITMPLFCFVSALRWTFERWAKAAIFFCSKRCTMLHDIQSSTKIFSSLEKASWTKRIPSAGLPLLQQESKKSSNTKQLAHRAACQPPVEVLKNARKDQKGSNAWDEVQTVTRTPPEKHQNTCAPMRSSQRKPPSLSGRFYPTQSGVNCGVVAT